MRNKENIIALIVSYTVSNEKNEEMERKAISRINKE
jgi:hypothetical protein